MQLQKMTGLTWLIVGATTEVATLKQALAEAEKRAATERTEREKYDAQVGGVRQELHALMEKHESLELDSRTRVSELKDGNGSGLDRVEQYQIHIHIHEDS